MYFSHQRLSSSRWQRQREHQAAIDEFELDIQTDQLAALDRQDGGQRAEQFTQVRLDCLNAEADVWMNDE